VKSELILIMQYQKMIKITTLKILFILSSLNVTAACADTSFISYNATSTKIGSSDFIEQVKSIENPERFRSVCNNQKKAEYCFNYAAYQDIVLENYQLAYKYHMKAFDLGEKESGVLIGHYQINYPERFDVDNRLSIDESIYYLEQAFKAGYPDATRLLMMIYRDSELNRIDYDKAEYYNEIAIKQNVIKSRALLASLYTHHMKDKPKIDKSIDLYEDDLMLEGNWESSLALANIYLNPEEFGSNKDMVKTLAYAYVTRDLRKDVVEPRVANVEDKVIKLLPQALSSEQLKQAKALYLELMAEMNSQHETK